jgi:hypothetical protein
MRPKVDSLTLEQRLQVTRRFAETLAKQAAPAMRHKVTTKRAVAQSRDMCTKFIAVKEEVVVMWKNRNFSDATPLHFVGLYAALYEHVFQVPALDLTQSTRIVSAHAAAKKLIAQHLGSHPNAVAQYLQWVFGREAAKVKTGTLNGWRPSWNQVFIPGKVLEDYILYTRKGAS